MDTKKRLFFKSVTWQVCGLISMTLVGLIVTGSLSIGGWIAGVGAILGFLSYFVHELVWSKISWGRKSMSQDEVQAGLHSGN